ncbi:MAG: 4Fe-4S dicluster domain-containing protein [Planctomycetia bacterium]|nr:4Fe-4S dicluster domain-containing protein [Planctomycetia bacterium]
MFTVEHISDAGVVGAGGAGFPTHVKLNSKADTVVVNAAECEPLLHKDKEILRHYTQDVILGLENARQLVGAERVVIGLKRKYGDLIDGVQSQLPENMEICPLDDVYPSGDEFLLVYQTLGRVIPPGGIPIQVGAVVLNVETSYNLGNVMRNLPVTEKFLTVGGCIDHPVSLRVPLGVTLEEVVRAAGGANIADPVYLVGGPMMGYLENAPQTARVTKTTGGILLLPQNHSLVLKIRRDWREIAKIAKSACDQCSFCTQLCPRNLLGHPIEPHKAMRSLMFGADVLVPGTQFCSGCNLCSRCSCPEGLDPRNVCQHNRQQWAASGQKWEHPTFRKHRADQHMQNRQTPIPKLIRRLGLIDYENHGPLDLARSDRVQPSVVAIALKQHIGKPCEPVVSVGDTVERGMMIGKPVGLGAAVHASISGTVTQIDAECIWIQR